MNKSVRQAQNNQRLLFKILDTGGTPTIVAVCPEIPSGEITITDTGPGIYDVAIENFKGPRGLANVQATAHLISVFASCTARSYSGSTLSLTIKTENDASSATDSSVDVCVEVY